MMAGTLTTHPHLVLRMNAWNFTPISLYAAMALCLRSDGDLPYKYKMNMKMASVMLRRVDWYTLTDVSEVLTASFIRSTTNTVNTSKMSINVCQTARRYIPEDSHLLTPSSENLKSYHWVCLEV
jgi:hypothetical protein